MLQPELADSRPLHAFYFTTETLYAYDPSDIASLPYDANIAEWQAVVGTSVPTDDISVILYGMEPVDYFKAEAELFRTNKFLIRLAQLKGGWPQFITYAKRCEQLVNSEDPWGFIAHDGAGIRKAWKDGEAQLKAAKHPMLRARLAFQLVRLAHHGHDPEGLSIVSNIPVLRIMDGQLWRSHHGCTCERCTDLPIGMVALEDLNRRKPTPTKAKSNGLSHWPRICCRSCERLHGTKHGPAVRNANHNSIDHGNAKE